MDSITDEDFEPYIRRKRMEKEKHKNRHHNLDEEQQNVLRSCINSRERRRMHDLNDALDQLRQSLPNSREANSRKMSKINTILHASSRLRLLTKKNEELQRLNEELKERLIEAGLSIPSINNVELLPSSQPILLPIVSGVPTTQLSNVSPMNGITIPGGEQIPFIDMTRIAHQFLTPSIPTALPQQRPPR